MHTVKAAALLFLAAAVLPCFAGGTPAGPVETGARQICESASGDHFGHPSNACWIAHDLAVARGAYGQAVAYIRTACVQYRRGDFCLYARAAQPQQIMQASVRRGADAQSVARGLESIEPLDIIDAEAGMLRLDRRSQPATSVRLKHRPPG